MKTDASLLRLSLGCALALIVAGCGGGTDSDSRVVDLYYGEPEEEEGPSANLVDENGNPTSELDVYDPLTLSLNNVAANTRFHVRITGPDGEMLYPGDGYVLETDEDGDALNHTLVQHLDATQSAFAQSAGGGPVVQRSVGASASLVGVAATGGYTVEVVDPDGEVAFEESFTVANQAHVYCADSTGSLQSSFTASDTVYAQVEQGDGSISDGSYDVYVISDLNPVLFDGAALPAAAGQVTVSGGEGLMDLGTFSSGAHDVVVDLDGDGRFTAGTDLISRARRLHPCFAVQTAAGSGTISAQIASDTHGNYRDVFDPEASSPDIRDVFAWTIPTQQSQVQETLAVDNYIVEHQDSWSDGDTLTDVTDGLEVAPLQSFASAEAPWRVWRRQSLEAGCYDAVIDVNRNGTFEAGTDIVDNMDNSGNTSCGLRVADAACSDNISITSHTDGEEIRGTAITLEGSVSAGGSAGELPESGQVTVTSGQESTTINLSINGSGAFSASIPLFSGDNQVTVSFIYADGSTCAKTLTLTNGSAASDNVKFRAQLLWDGSTDMDIHLVRPGGDYFTSSDDCYYANCQVGLNAESANLIDWGVAGEDDDPKLDVDCIACGNGVENLWLNEIPQDGIYTVYVDAFSGSETNVRVAIFIGNSQVATVHCGDMASGTSTDTCRVGEINWTGGNDGTATFTGDGSKDSRSAFTSVMTQTAMPSKTAPR